MEWNGVTISVTVQFPSHSVISATHRVLGDGEQFEGSRIPIRDKAPAPAIWFFNETPVVITEQWQYAIVGANPGMSLQHISALLNNGRMVSNTDAGFGGRTPKLNYILRENLNNESAELPRYNKAWTMTNAKVRMVSGVVKTFNPLQPPPLRAGARYPSRVEEVDPDAYLYTPQNAPELFFNCISVDRDGTLDPFPNGAIYSWTGDGIARSFLPFLSRGPATYPPNVFSGNSARLTLL